MLFVRKHCCRLPNLLAYNSSCAVVVTESAAFVVTWPGTTAEAIIKDYYLHNQLVDSYGHFMHFVEHAFGLQTNYSSKLQLHPISLILPAFVSHALSSASFSVQVSNLHPLAIVSAAIMVSITRAVVILYE